MRSLRSPFFLLVLCSILSCSGRSKDELWLIGLDAGDWDLLDPMLAAGQLPNLAALRAESAYGRLLSDEPMLSPILWNSIATGKSADLHGVTWFMSDLPDGRKIPVSSHNRWVRALWTIASEQGREVGVVGSWATWPADPVNGFTVSDYVGWHSFGVSGQELDTTGKTYPEDLAGEITPYFPDPDAIDVSLLQRMVHLPEDRLGFDADAGPFGGPVQHLRQAISTTIGYTDLTIAQIQRERPGFLALYYEGTDAAQHLFGNYMPPRLPWVSEGDFAAYRDVVTQYWQWQDQQLGKLLRERGPRTTIMIVSDHGFRIGDERLKEDEFTIERADQSHMPDGILLVAGPAIQPGTRLSGASIYDVAPTALHLMGMPVADDMIGRVLEEALRPEFAQEHPIRKVPSYETTPFARAPLPTGGDGAAMEEMLRSLGYIGGGEGEGQIAPGNVEQAVNMAVVLRRRGKLEEAERTLLQALEEFPGHVEARSNLARVYAEMDRISDAEAIYRELWIADPTNLQHCEDYALALAHEGKDDEALEVFDAGLEVDPQWAIGFAGRGFALHHLGRSADGLVSVDRAVQMDPSLAHAHYYRGVIQHALGRDEEAVASLRRALELDPANAQASVELSRLGGLDPSTSIAALQQALTSAPDDASLRAELGAQYLRLSQPEQALPHLRAASSEFPDDPAIQGNLGMAYAMGGDLASAAVQFERVLELEPENLEAMATLGQIRLQLGQPERAERLLARAAERAPDNAGVQYSLGEFYHRTGQLALAKRQYEEAIRLDPTVGAFIYQLAMVYGQEGDEAKALELIDKARQLDPSLPEPPRR